MNNKNILILILFLANVTLFGQDVPDFEPYSYPNTSIFHDTIDGVNVYKWKKTKQNISQYVRLYCESGSNINYGNSGEGLFVEGKKHGRWQLKSCNTRIIHIMNYDMGLITGEYKAYYEYYKPIQKDKDWTNIKCDTTYYETTFVDGNGFWKDFYSNGDVKETGQYKSGKKEGEWLYYYEDNILYQKRLYKDGGLIKTEDVELPKGYIKFLDY